MNDFEFLISSMFTDFLFLSIFTLALLGPILFWYLNSYGNYNADRTLPFINIYSLTPFLMFFAIALSISIPHISTYSYQTLNSMQCSSSNYDTRDIIDRFSNREFKVVRAVEYRRLVSEFNSCDRENKIEQGLMSRFGERSVSTSSI